MIGIILALGYNEIAVSNFGMIVGLVALIFLSDNSSVFNKKEI